MSVESAQDVNAFGWILGVAVALAAFFFKHISPFHVVARAMDMVLEKRLQPLDEKVSLVQQVVVEMPGGREALDRVMDKRNGWKPNRERKSESMD